MVMSPQRLLYSIFESAGVDAHIEALGIGIDRTDARVSRASASTSRVLESASREGHAVCR